MKGGTAQRSVGIVHMKAASALPTYSICAAFLLIARSLNGDSGWLGNLWTMSRMRFLPWARYPSLRVRHRDRSASSTAASRSAKTSSVISTRRMRSR